MAKIRPYHEQVTIENTLKLRELISELPMFVADFFKEIETRTSSGTRIAYAYDLRVFFDFLQKSNPHFKDSILKNMPVSILDKLKTVDLEEYKEYLKYYSNSSDKEHLNMERGITRKLASLKSFYKYYYKRELIETNPAALIELPKIHTKNIVRLDLDEIVKLLDLVEDGNDLTTSQKRYHTKTKIRDLAILTLLLGTGMRVSECVGIDITDIDFNNGGILIHRKGGNEVVLYMSEEVEEALQTYYNERKTIIAETGSENAFFLSMQRKRINVRSVENLVKKYTSQITPLKNITPHKLRSTYGTNLYRETGDIYLVADVLGHSDVNTTRKHYAALDDERRRSAKDKVQLREKRKD